MSCQHEWTESIRCSRCGQAVESRIEVGRQLDAALALLQRWKNRKTHGLARDLWRDTAIFLSKHGRPA